MCLAVPGLIIEKHDAQATVDFQGSRVVVSLMLTPEAEVGGWVLVHAGFAISMLDENEARETWSYLAQAGLVDEIPGAAAENRPAGKETH